MLLGSEAAVVNVREISVRSGYSHMMPDGVSVSRARWDSQPPAAA